MAETNFLIGVVGLLLLLIAFIANLLKRLSPEAPSYNLVNVLGAGFLAYYAFTIKSPPFFILESIWGGFALYKLLTTKSD